MGRVFINKKKKKRMVELIFYLRKTGQRETRPVRKRIGYGFNPMARYFKAQICPKLVINHLAKTSLCVYQCMNN